MYGRLGRGFLSPSLHTTPYPSQIGDLRDILIKKCCWARPSMVKQLDLERGLVEFESNIGRMLKREFPWGGVPHLDFSCSSW